MKRILSYFWLVGRGGGGGGGVLRGNFHRREQKTENCKTLKTENSFESHLRMSGRRKSFVGFYPANLARTRQGGHKQIPKNVVSFWFLFTFFFFFGGQRP